MAETDMHSDPQPTNDFSTQAEQKQIGIVHEFWDFLRHNKKWWLIPIIVLLVLLGALIVVGGSVPWIIYPL